MSHGWLQDYQAPTTSPKYSRWDGLGGGRRPWSLRDSTFQNWRDGCLELASLSNLIYGHLQVECLISKPAMPQGWLLPWCSDSSDGFYTSIWV